MPQQPDSKIAYLPDQTFNNQTSATTIPGPYPQGGYSRNESAEEYPINDVRGYQNTGSAGLLPYPRDPVLHAPVCISVGPIDRNTRDKILSTPVSIPLE